MHDLNIYQRRDQWQRLASNVLDRRIGIYMMSELTLAGLDDIEGFSSPNIAGLVMARRPDLYRGPIPCVVINDQRLIRLSPEFAAIDFDALITHELGHVVELAITSEDCREGDADLLLNTLYQPWRSWPSHAGAAWAGHGAQYIRALTHLLHRLNSRGVSVCGDLAFPSCEYGLRSSLDEFRQALGDEPSRNSWRPLSEVLHEAAPIEFTELWAANVSGSKQTSLH